MPIIGVRAEPAKGSSFEKNKNKREIPWIPWNTLDTKHLPILVFPSSNPPLFSLLSSLLLVHSISNLSIMRSSIIFLSALATAVMTDNSTDTYTFPAGFNIGLVDSGTLSMYPDQF